MYEIQNYHNYVQFKIEATLSIVKITNLETCFVVGVCIDPSRYDEDVKYVGAFRINIQR